MRRKILYFTTIIAMVLFAACSNEDALPETTGRTLSLTASMPDEPDTRVTLAAGATATVVKWVVGDIIELAFVPTTGAKQKVTATVNKIDNNGKKAHFTINIPTGITGAFKLYGVYGGGGIDITGTNLFAKLPTDLGTTTSLLQIQEKKHVMLYFEGVTMNTTALVDPKVSFKHIGALFCIKVKNIGSSDLAITGAQLGGLYDNSEIVGVATTSFDLVNGKFTGLTPLIPKISFAAPATILTKKTGTVDGKMEFWGWYPPSTKKWDYFNFRLLDGSPYGKRTVSSKPGQTALAGNTYYFYGVWDGKDLSFTTKANF